MPWRTAVFEISMLDARATARRSISSVTAITSCNAMRPRNPVLEQWVQPTGWNSVGAGWVGSPRSQRATS